MKTVAVISQKGGVGKTTIATGLAVAAEADGRSTVFIDLDPQGSAGFWHGTREAEVPAFTSSTPLKLGELRQVSEEAGADLVVIDTPPQARDAAYQAAQAADLVLIPTRPAILDVMAMTTTLEMGQALDKPTFVILSFCPSASRELSDTIETITGMGGKVCPVHLGNRIAFSRAQQTGQTAMETEPEGKAAHELQELYIFTAKALGWRRRKG